MNLIIGSGWWCDGSGEHAHSPWQEYVCKETRQKSFFELWYKSAIKCNPRDIVIIDSNSPIKPPRKPNVKLISLTKNYGAAIEGIREKRLSGWDMGVIFSAFYAMLNDADYYVYIEQDCILIGDGIIDYAIENMRNGIMFGDGVDTPQPVQQSLIIVRKDMLLKFILSQLLATKTELSLSPEKRYSIFFPDADWLPFGYGRVRPINYNDNFWYAQHLREDELRVIEKLFDIV